MAYDPIPLIDVVVEKVPPGNSILILPETSDLSNKTRVEVESIMGVKLGEESFTTSAKRKQRFLQGMDKSPKFSPEEFDSNLNNITGVVNINAIALADLMKKRTVLRENFISGKSTTVSNKNEDSVLHKIIVPSESVVSGGEVGLECFLSSSSSQSNKTIKVKMNGTVLYDSSLSIPTITNPIDSTIIIDFVVIRDGDTSGFLMGKTQIIGSSSVTTPLVGRISGLNWDVDQSIEIVARTPKSNEITLLGGRVNIPLPVNEYVKWEYVNEGGDQVRRKVGYGNKFGDSPLILSNFEKIKS